MPFTPETAHTGTQFKPGQSGNPAGAKKGSKHINTWIQEILEDEEFEAQIRQGYEIVDWKGAPIKAIIQAQLIKAMSGDSKAFDALAKYGWTQRLEQDTKVTLVNPIMKLEESNALLGDNSNS